MEHRWNERRPVHLPVVLYNRQGQSSPGCIRNLSLEGLFVETCLDTLQTGSMLRIGICLPASPGRKEFRVTLPALVIHQTRSGIGLMLSQPMTEETVQRLSHTSGGSGNLAA